MSSPPTSTCRFPRCRGSSPRSRPPSNSWSGRLLAKAPADRVQSADELIRAIDAVTPDRTAATTGSRGVVPIATSPSVTTLSGSASTSMRMPSANRRGRWPLVVFSAAMAAVGALVVVLVMRSGDHGGPAAESPAIAAAPSTPPANAAPHAEEPSPPPPAPNQAPSGSPAPSAEPSPPSTDGTAAPTPATPPSAARPEPPAAAPQAPLEEATIDVAVDSVPPGAQVILDGHVLGTTPFRGAAPRQDRDVKLVLRLAGHVDRTVVVHASRPITEHIKLVRPAPPAAPRPKVNRDKSVNPFD